ncbi:MAG: uroporphyrinogen III methyltransferase [Pseudomonadota bacterium]|nr:uroporphyrinogen-III synthase [Rubrivivax sp.]
MDATPAPPRVIVTRPAAQAGAWVDALRALGVDAAALPLIGIEPPAQPERLEAAWAGLTGHALVMFVSANAVQKFFAAARGRPWPAGLTAGCTGPGTQSALRAAGVPEEAIVAPAAAGSRFDSEALWALLCARDWRGRSALVVRGEAGRDWLAETLRAAGAEVAFVAAYRRVAPRWGAAERALYAAALAAPRACVWLFSSSEAVRHLATLAPPPAWQAARVLATHPRIAEAARAAGFGQVDLVEPRPQAVAQALQAAA